MRLNGLYVVCEMAVRALDDAIVTEHRAPFILGSLREDVWFLRGPGRAKGLVVEHLSFSHFYEPGLPGGIVPLVYPGPRMKADVFYRRAIRAWRRGDRAKAFVELGRVAHLITDMSCPVHAHRVVHETDPFEWWVEAHKDELLALPVPSAPEGSRASDFVDGMARFTQPYRADRTNHLVGRVLKSLGRRKGVTHREAEEQGRVLIPMAAGYTISLLRLFLRESSATAAPDECSRAPIAS